jgi:hypothetical protein
MEKQMTINRVLMVLLAALLLPGLAMAQTATRATFAVTKDFTDSNTAAVTVTLDCSSGLPLVQHQQLTEAGGQWPLVVFILESFGANTNCSVTEAAVTGYSTSYSDGEAGPCNYTDVQSGEDLTCLVTNEPIPQEVEVCKDWVIEGDGGDLIDSNYEITLECNNEIVGSKEYNGKWKRRFYNESGTSNTCDYTADVVPKWNGGTTCTAHEEINDSSVDVSDDCSFNVALAETGEGCTITNTVFYEGIPTLSQYGLAILALLMLGVGFVGFRRFV